MMKKIIYGFVVIFLMIESALARVEPAFVRVDQYGIEPATWLALIVMLCALIDNVGRFLDKKAKDSTLKYNYAYMKITIIAIILAGQAQLQIPVVELNLGSIIGAVLLGLGGNVIVTQAAKSVKAKVTENGRT